MLFLTIRTRALLPLSAGKTSLMQITPVEGASVFLGALAAGLVNMDRKLTLFRRVYRAEWRKG
jgi:hypothetical protein